ncbi:MAG TPA: hypothetical protein VI072_25085 [Polyangiaceae bacterium]
MTSYRPSRPPREAPIYRRALSLAAAGLTGIAVLVGWSFEPGAPTSALRRLSRLQLAPGLLAAQPTRLSLHQLSAAERARGYHECNPADPMGIGPYKPYRNLCMGRMLVPQRGGHTPDGGYDVVVHFHGYEATRKTLVQVARGVVYVGIDKGLNSGPYERAFASPEAFPTLLRSIDKNLKAETGNPSAFVRHVALTAWSAGYGAVNQILKKHADAVDAVVLLDGLHGSWDVVRSRDPHEPLTSTSIAPTVEFARRAVRGEKIFIFSHSAIDPVEYPSTSETADNLLLELGVKREPVNPGTQVFAQDSKAEAGGFYVWSYKGRNELAHCAHIPLMAKALHIIESAWRTPAMDRNVPMNPPPKRWPQPTADDAKAVAEAESAE